MNKRILLWFDVEDYLTPESDDAFLELLTMLEESGVKATIKFCTKKLALLRERGRTDIMEKLANHEMAFHTTNHSIHPLPTEYLDSYGFRDGAREFEARERKGYRLLQDLTGQNLTSYGQPGVAWAPQVFPVLRKWGIPTYLDCHDILGLGGQPFWYGGVLCYTKLNNLSHLVKDGSAGNKMIKAFDEMNTECTDTVFFSIYDHPTEFSSTAFWDEVNFVGGRNPYTYRPAPLRTLAERDALIHQYREFIEYTRKQPDVEYVTALESLRFEHQRTQPITGQDMVSFAKGCTTEVNYAKIKGGYLAPSELLGLMARHLTGRMLVPELVYGPESHDPSMVMNPTVNVAELAEAAFRQHGRVLGFKQLPCHYKAGGNLINPVDMFATLAAAVREGGDTVKVATGARLAAADHVDETYRFGGNWILWDKDFKAENIFKHTKLQTWTLKPAIF